MNPLELLRPFAFRQAVVSAGCLATLLAANPASSALAAEETQSSAGARSAFRFAPVSDASLGLWEGDQPVLVYNHGVISNPETPAARSRSSYLHPIYGLDGEVLTGDFPADHVNHRGLHWAWPHIQIGDQEVDLWSLRGIRIDFKRWLGKETNPNAAVLGIENGWIAGDQLVMREFVRIETHRATAGSRAIDVTLTWTPTDREITLWGSAGKSYGGFTLRFGTRSQTIITVPSGRTSEDLLMAKLPWADLSGDLKTPGGALSGAAVFVHSTHPDHPPTWMTRHYGMLAVGWPGVTPQRFAAGKPFSCRYRLWIHRGAPDAKTIQQAYEAYIR